MRYEDWIKYETVRQNQANHPAWISLPVEDGEQKRSSKPAQKPPAWTMVIQIFDSSRI